VGLEHRNLINDLAQFFQNDRIVFVEPSLGTNRHTEVDHCIPDVLTLNKSYANPLPTIYEIKISRADFLSDSQSGKFVKYQKLCQRFYYAVPKGLVKKTEVPTTIGLIVRNENSWRVYKSCRLNAWEGYDLPTIQALLMNGVFTDRKIRRLKDMAFAQENATLAEKALHFPSEIYLALSELERIKKRMDSGDISANASHAVNALCTVLGLEKSEIMQMSKYEIERELTTKNGIKQGLEIIRYGLGYLDGNTFFMKKAREEIEKLFSLDVAK
jgi:hypothetical protein